MLDKLKLKKEPLSRIQEIEARIKKFKQDMEKVNKELGEINGRIKDLETKRYSLLNDGDHKQFLELTSQIRKMEENEQKDHQILRLVLSREIEKLEREWHPEKKKEIMKLGEKWVEKQKEKPPPCNQFRSSKSMKFDHAERSTYNKPYDIVDFLCEKCSLRQKFQNKKIPEIPPETIHFSKRQS